MCFDIEVNENDPDKLVDIICALEPTFGGVNLETSRRPSASTSSKNAASAWAFRCSTMTSMAPAIVSAAAVLNSLRLVNKDIDKGARRFLALAPPPSPAWSLWWRWV